MVAFGQEKVRKLKELIAVATMIQQGWVVLEIYLRCHSRFNGREGQSKYGENFSILTNIPRRPS